MPVFSKSYYPHWRQPTPPREQSIINTLAWRRFGHHYDTDSGVVYFPESRGQLKPRWAKVLPQDLCRPEVQYFLRRNPGHARGDELVCLTELHPDNLRPLARRLFMQGLQG